MIQRGYTDIQTQGQTEILRKYDFHDLTHKTRKSVDYRRTKKMSIILLSFLERR